MTTGLSSSRLLREPLLHFLLIGCALFVAYSLLNEEAVDDSRIVISEAQVHRLTALWEKKWQRPPTRQELEGLIEQQVREEVLYREAMNLGLDQDDGIIRRRLAQKLEFISDDLAELAEPADNELSEYLVKHRERFEVPARIDFVQVYISPEVHGEGTGDYAEGLLADLSANGMQADISGTGDPIMLEQQHEQVTEHDVARLFGKPFAQELFTLPVGSWQGPVLSGYGLHLVRIANRTQPQLPAFEVVREDVHEAWLADQRRSMNEAFYQGLRQRYEIVIEAPQGKDTLARQSP